MDSLLNEYSARYLEQARALRPTIIAAREEIERGRRLPRSIVDALKRAGMFRIAMPREWGGPELDLLTQIRLIEELSAADGSVGWCIMIGCDSGYLSAFLDQRVAREMYPDLDMVTGSSFGKPAGRAERTRGGYRVSGRWKFSSGCQHSDWLVGGCIVHEAGGPVTDEKGLPATRCCFMPAAQCEIIDTWYTTGLRGTGSNDFAANDLFVPEERTFSWQNPQVLRSGTLYAMPTIFLAKVGGVPLGIAREALRVFSEHARKTAARQFIEDGVLTAPVTMAEQANVQSTVARATALIGSARSYFFDIMADTWETLNPGQRLSAAQLGAFFLSVTNTFAQCVEAVDLLFKAAGGPAVYAGPLDRAFRDIHTASQHTAVSARTYEIAGRGLLGLKPLQFFF
jgi:alkylation response protein AidB-like acyl-CoA dehydrogenase